MTATATPTSTPTPTPTVPEAVAAAAVETDRYARCIEVSKRIRWDIEADVIRGRSFDFGQAFLPEGLARTQSLVFLSAAERLKLNQIQGRTYANMFGLVERFISAKILELSRDHWFGDQVALEALVRFTDEELKHQALFRRIDELLAPGMPPGYRFAADPDAVAGAVMAAGTWAVLGLTCHIELFTQVHYRQSMASDSGLSALYKDVFLYHWKEESQHAIIDELEWRRVDARMTAMERNHAVQELIGLVQAVDGILQQQSEADGRYFADSCGRTLTALQADQVTAALLAAYRWQYIVSGVQDARFNAVLGSLIDGTQARYIQVALAPLMA
jgi:hypothetical protein